MAAAVVAAEVKTFEQLVEEKKPYYERRIKLFEGFQERQKQRVEDDKQANVQIKVVLPDGKCKEAVKGVTTPLDIATDISKGLAKKCVVAKVDGAAWDLFRPLEGDCTLQLFSFEDAEGKDVSPCCGCSEAACMNAFNGLRVGRRALLRDGDPPSCI